MPGTWSDHERRVLESLDRFFDDDEVRAQLDVVASRVERNLAEHPEARLAWEPVPLELYRHPLPDGVRSSWVFILRAGVSTGAERHPNSIQRVMSYRDGGDFRVMYEDKEWTSHFLSSGRRGPIDERWVSIPEMTWHEPVVGAVNWVVVSFHTVPAADLIEERPGSRQRVYVEHEI